jgi:hypothetical protein
MAFVQRNGGNQVIGVFANKQPGVAEEELADDHPEVAAFRSKLFSDDPRKAAIKAEANVIDMADRIKNATGAQIDTWFQNNVTTLAQARVVLATLTKILATRL